MNALKRGAGYAVLTVFALVFIYPFILSAATTLKPRDEAVAHPVLPWPLNPEMRAWENLLIHSDFPVWTLNSVIVTVFATLLRLFLASLAGYALARLNWRGRGVVFAGVIAVLAVPPIVLTVPRFLVLKELGLINTYSGLILPLAVDAVGVFIMKQFFDGLPKELEEAARIDGAGIFTTYWRIILPLARPGLLTLAILSFQGTWNEFLLPLIVVRASPEHWTLPFGLSTLGKGGAMGQTWDYPVMMAGSMLTILPLAIVFIVLQRFFVGGMTSGALKG
ncbi:carbohydrate ABC transporter permease [Nonomuraea muscovyensis]|uniref:carbohydrate ABC transporter permease n=1 Tax=Nonomuraea muscovyensis TaxID=1124761 RepID=UPI0033C2D4BF|nr:binding-protein-dependent transport system inner rane component [Nonomuraea muscovyensis]